MMQINFLSVFLVHLLYRVSQDYCYQQNAKLAHSKHIVEYCNGGILRLTYLTFDTANMSIIGILRKQGLLPVYNPLYMMQ